VRRRAPAKKAAAKRAPAKKAAKKSGRFRIIARKRLGFGFAEPVRERAGAEFEKVEWDDDLLIFDATCCRDGYLLFYIYCISKQLLMHSGGAHGCAPPE
jgi:hypothetical protein